MDRCHVDRLSTEPPTADELKAILDLAAQAAPARFPCPAGPPEDLSANIVEVEGPLLRDPGERRFYTTSSCGVCGKGAMEEVAVHCAPLPDGPVLARELLADLPERLPQPAFERTGGLHATGLFDAKGSCCWSARTWDGTTRWTRSWVGPCWTGGCRSRVT